MISPKWFALIAGWIMNVEQIKQAVDDGKKVYWTNCGYQVVKDDIGQYFITYKHNNYCIGLTWRDGVTLNGEESDFYTH